jgi:ATP-dependent RNA helicase RhlE
MSFNDLQLIEPVLKALCDEGYTIPTPVQEQAIPVILQQKDVLGCAQTGTGKTAAFAIPMLQLMHQQGAQSRERRRSIKALVLTPTRELAIQVGESFQAYGKYLPLKHLVIYGGVSQYAQVNALTQGTDILVATPGRLLDLLNQRHLTLADIKYFVLDEADRMLDMGFIHDVKRIIAKLPSQRQTLFFSATMSPEIQALSSSLLKHPVRVTATPPATTVDLIEQSLYHVDKENKRPLLISLLSDQNIKTALVFTRTKHGADRITKELTRAGIKSGAIHGNKSQNSRQLTLLNFKTGKIRVLVATDIAARGIDVDGMTHVFNFELPNVPETYVHRIGRTGRAGATGTAISFCDLEEREYLRDIQKLIKKEIPVVREHAFYNPVMHASQRPLSQPALTSGRQNSGSARKNGRNFSRQRA